MAVVCKIVQDFCGDNQVYGFIFSFTGDKAKNNKRLLLYKRTITRYYPTATIEYIDGIYQVLL